MEATVDSLKEHTDENCEDYKDVIEFLNEFKLFPYVLVSIIINYFREVQYEPMPAQTFTSLTSGVPYGIISDNEKFIYVCDWYDFSPTSLIVFNLLGERMEQDDYVLPLFHQPSDIDIYDNKIFLISEANIDICNLNLGIVFSFTLPHSVFCWNHLRVHNNLIYVTIESLNEIYVYTMDGKVKNTIGSSHGSTKAGEFFTPLGFNY